MSLPPLPLLSGLFPVSVLVSYDIVIIVLLYVVVTIMCICVNDFAFVVVIDFAFSCIASVKLTILACNSLISFLGKILKLLPRLMDLNLFECIALTDEGGK